MLIRSNISVINKFILKKNNNDDKKVRPNDIYSKVTSKWV